MVGSGGKARVVVRPAATGTGGAATLSSPGFVGRERPEAQRRLQRVPGNDARAAGRDGIDQPHLYRLRLQQLLGHPDPAGDHRHLLHEDRVGVGATAAERVGRRRSSGGTAPDLSRLPVRRRPAAQPSSINATSCTLPMEAYWSFPDVFGGDHVNMPFAEIKFQEAQTLRAWLAHGPVRITI